ncbi:MAG: 5-oxoprolinase [Candidatus Entotheonella gemina]|uniref:5-oxoprolinase n=1 Tax=Candidatus Entotheonella gemina TaxID=1429439 RepID=W4LP28_9BACT|nr:MAG: 5-oxoprolinase [Candidatus Entotheonella gemina]
MNYDPIRLEVFRNLLRGISEEMGVTLCRTAFSPNIKERRDFSCALFDGEGHIIAQAAHIPVHLGAMPMSVRHAIDNVDMAPGDGVLVNDPYGGGSHLPDITLVTPVFLEGQAKPAFFTANRAHHADVGGMTPGSMPLSTEVFQEGIRIPPIRLIVDGQIQHDLLQLLLANVRTPREREGDLTAQIAANRTGERRLRETVAKYGLDEVLTYCTELQAYSERMTRHVIADIPDGDYTFEDVMDNDGILPGPVLIKVTIRVRGDEVEIDFTGSDAQVRGSVNANFAITMSAVYYCVRTLSKEPFPFNHGCLVPVNIKAEAGSVVNCEFPSAVAGGNVETSQRIVDVVLGAFQRAVPGRVAAACSGSMNNVTVGGFDPRRGEHYTYYETIAGGTGGRPGLPGMHATHSHMTNTLNTPIEALEYAYPLRVSRYAIRRKSGGQGAYNGGDGVVRELEFLGDAQVTRLSDRREYPPYGLEGGESAKTGENLLIHNKRRRKLPSKFNMQVEAGDRLVISTPGGGGYGSREPDAES